MVSNEALKRGVLAYKEGRKDDARRFFEQVIEADEQNEKAWLGLSRVVEDDEERQICLENVLTINPSNETAQKVLSHLTVQQQEAVPDTEGWQDINAFLLEDPPFEQSQEIGETDSVPVVETVRTPLYRPQPTAPPQEKMGGGDKLLMIATAVVFFMAVIAAVIILPGLMG